MGVLWFKIFRDLWLNKGRTFQVVITIAIGAAAIGMIMTTRNMVVPGMQKMWQSMNPAMINVFVGPGATDDELFVLKKVSGVKDIEGESVTTIEWRVNPQDEWRQGGLTSRATYTQQKMNKLELVGGSWPSKGFVDINNGDDRYFHIPYPGGTVTFRINKKEYQVKVGGMVYSQLNQPAFLEAQLSFLLYQKITRNGSAPRITPNYWLLHPNGMKKLSLTWLTAWKIN